MYSDCGLNINICASRTYQSIFQKLIFSSVSLSLSLEKNEEFYFPPYLPGFPQFHH